MKFTHETWPISKILELYGSDRLTLNPPYQRNPIWSLSAQQKLLDTILRGWPMPNFFILKRSSDNYEVVDGQQRARTILGFYRGCLTTEDTLTYRKISKTAVGDAFRNYCLSVTVLSDLIVGESIELFYTLVNSTGLRLNSPEIRKAKFYSSNALRLVTRAANLPGFKAFCLFSRLSLKRMNDIEFAAELVGLLRYGNMDKKDNVDDIFKDDVSDAESNTLFAEFRRITAIITQFNAVFPLAQTRYRQKNDFYTLFGFLHEHSKLSTSYLRDSYEVLLKVGPHISPSQNRCVPLKKYALNCVTQSNSKRARDERSRFFVELLANHRDKPSRTQRAIVRHLGAVSGVFVRREGYTCIATSSLP